MAPDLPRQAVDAKSSLGRDDLPHGRPIDWHDQAFQYQFNGIPYPINAGSHDAYQYKAQAQQQPAAYNAPFDMHDMASALPMEQYGQSMGQHHAVAPHIASPQNPYAFGPYSQPAKGLQSYHDQHSMIAQQQGFQGRPVSYGAPVQHFANQLHGPYMPSYAVQMPMRSGQPSITDPRGRAPADDSMSMPYGHPSPYHGQSMNTSSSGARATFAPSGANTAISYVSPGPPRKPKQNGHALWVGNLPLNATVVDLKDHFSRGATNDILSLKLMSRSNCAFVNYKDGEACAAAMKRFAGSRFHGTPLVCRLRRTTDTEKPSSPLAKVMNKTAEVLEKQPPEPECDGEVASTISAPSSPTSSKGADAYFVLKSLTLDDLVASTHRGTWTTQPHNEKGLNRAFDSYRNVYLLFSVNKSGEYFGLARMMSPITPSSEATNIQAFSYSRDGHASSASDMTADAPVGEGIASMVPKVVPTPATETAPAGYIVDDLTRGIIFWEVKSDGEETAIESAIDDSVIGEGSESGPLEPHRSATEPTRSFRVEWLSVNRVPFYRTRGLKNAFNDGKDVKIARDGTRIEPEVGAKLTGLFRPVGGGPAMLN